MARFRWLCRRRHIRDFVVDSAGQSLYYVGQRSDGKGFGYVARVNAASGAAVWTREVRATSQAFAWGVELDSSGNPVVVGQIFGTADFDPGSGELNLGDAKGTTSVAYAWKLTSAGALGWASAFNGGTSIARDVTLDAANNVYVAGRFSGKVDFDPGKATYNLTSDADGDAFLTRLSPAGAFQYAKSLGGTTANQIEIDATGSLYVLTTISNQRVDAIKLNSSGVVQSSAAVLVTTDANNPEVRLSARIAINRSTGALNVVGSYDGALHTSPDADYDPSTPGLSGADPLHLDLFWATFGQS